MMGHLPPITQETKLEPANRSQHLYLSEGPPKKPSRIRSQGLAGCRNVLLVDEFSGSLDVSFVEERFYDSTNLVSHAK